MTLEQKLEEILEALTPHYRNFLKPKLKELIKSQNQALLERIDDIIGKPEPTELRKNYDPFRNAHRNQLRRELRQALKSIDRER